MECGPQYHQRTCQNEVQLSVDLSTIREPVRTKCSGVWSVTVSQDPAMFIFTALPESLIKTDLVTGPIIYYQKNKNKVIFKF